MAIVRAKTRAEAIRKIKKNFPVAGKRIRSARKVGKDKYEVITG